MFLSAEDLADISDGNTVKKEDIVELANNAISDALYALEESYPVQFDYVGQEQWLVIRE